MSKHEKTKGSAIAEPKRFHLDPVLVGFILFAIIMAIVRIASAQGIVPPAVSDACSEAKIFGVPITELLNLGVPALIAIYSIAKGMPDMQKRFDTQSEKDRTESLAWRTSMEKKYDELGARIDRALDRGARAGD